MNKNIFIGMAGLVFAVFLPAASALNAASGIPKARYLAYARASADWTFNHKAETIEKWKASFDPDNVFGYRPPGGLLEMATIYAYLHEREGNPEYARRAKEVLLTYGDYRSLYPESSVRKRPDYGAGLPALPDFFTVMRYLRAYEILNRLGRFSSLEKENAEQTIVDSMAYLLRTQEWGPMNRSALRAESLAWAVKTLPDRPESKAWEMQRRALGDDNWGNWQIEDATIYNGVWLYSVLGYADALGRLPDLFGTPEMYYYARYYLNLISPAGTVADYGDANWLANWPQFLAFFEAAAGHYRDPRLKWAASTVAETFVDFKNPANVGLGYMLLDCYRWGSDQVSPAEPDGLSREVMEDVQGKKIVFRDGWRPESTYLLLNYRDEGDGGLNFRDYLRDTIPVEEEKMTHGHADENSIVLLMSGKSVLLHDGGYRDYMPSGPYGAYRQDYFHNRLCVRPEKIWMGQKPGEARLSVPEAVPGQGLLEFIRNAGSYRRVRTQKVDFLTFPEFDYSRTRLLDDDWGFESDRIIVFVKDPGLFVVFDVFKARLEGWFTLANLWHTRAVLARGNHWYDTAYDRIQSAELPRTKNLMIVFPLTHFRLEGVEPEKRHYQDEFLIHQTAAQHFELGETAGFITVLIPHPAGEDPAPWAAKVKVLAAEPARNGLGVELRLGERSVIVGVKGDLRSDIARDWRRPRYTYEAGRIRWGDLESNGDFLFAELTPERLRYSIVNLTKALFRGRLLVEAGDGLFGLAFDGSRDQSGVGKLRYWRDDVPLK